VFFADFALFSKGGRATLIRKESGVALAPETPFGRQPAVSGTLEIDEHFPIDVVHRGADRHHHDRVFPPGAVLTLGRPVLTVGGSAKRVIAKAQQRRLIVVSLEPDVSATSPVAAIGSALCDVGFATKTDAASTAIASFGVQLSVVNEGRHPSILRFGLFSCG
jgi:hypothetical protein